MALVYPKVYFYCKTYFIYFFVKSPDIFESLPDCASQNVSADRPDVAEIELETIADVSFGQMPGDDLRSDISYLELRERKILGRGVKPAKVHEYIHFRQIQLQYLILIIMFFGQRRRFLSEKRLERGVKSGKVNEFPRMQPLIIWEVVLKLSY